MPDRIKDYYNPPQLQNTPTWNARKRTPTGPRSNAATSNYKKFGAKRVEKSVRVYHRGERVQGGREFHP